MRLFWSIFIGIAGQAAVAVVVAALLLVLNLHGGFATLRPGVLDDASRVFLVRQYAGIAGVAILLLLALLLAAWVVARRVSTAMAELQRASSEIAQGDFSLDIREGGPREIQVTLRNLGRIARQFDRLETARRSWLVGIAEELRKPVEALAERMDALASGDPPVDPTVLNAIDIEGHRLGTMVEDLHAVALADLGRLPVRFVQVDPRALIHNAVWANSKRAQAQGLTLETSTLPEYTILVKWDAERIEQLFGAVIENSLRYTPAGGRIVLGLESQRSAWRLTIDDTAPGVDVDLAQQLFEPFYRAPTTAADPVAGSGLGLATARAIVEAHHGRIEASRSPLGGLRVTVVLPANPPIV